MRGQRTLLILGGIAVVLIFFLASLVFRAIPQPIIEIKGETLWEIGPLPIKNTLLTSWGVVLFLIIAGYLLGRNLKWIPSGWQNFIEAAIEGIHNLVTGTAGEKNGVGSTFEDIAAVLEGIDARERVGVCFDTCHAFGAGYELRTGKGIDTTVRLFDQILGEKSCMLIHLNDSKGGLGSGLDRHEHIGLGNIGEEGFRLILSRPFFRSRPLICETPVDERRDDAGNIRVVRELAGD